MPNSPLIESAEIWSVGELSGDDGTIIRVGRVELVMVAKSPEIAQEIVRLRNSGEDYHDLV